jgi:hypothetical protein
MQPSDPLTNLRSWFALALALALLSWSALSQAQERLERQGVILYWGLVPEAIVSRQHAIDELHGGRPPGGGKINHLVIALFDAKTGRRIDDAIVRAQLAEPGIVDQPPKYLPPMPVNGLGSYGQLFGMVYDAPYRFRVWVKLQERQGEIEFTIDTAPQVRRR